MGAGASADQRSIDGERRLHAGGVHVGGRRRHPELHGQRRQISEATSVFPSTCVAGTRFDLTATFETVVTANSRYDVGFWFNTEGGDSARGSGGLDECSISALTPALSPSTNLDGDACGDLNAGTYALTFTIEDVLCEAAEGTNELRLPNCTSWHNKAGTVCSPNTSVFEFFPDTKSKCVCDDTFTVPVEVVSLGVVKTTTTPTLVEPGGTATYEVRIENTSDVNVEIVSIIDAPFGDVGAGNPPGVSANTCPSLIGVVLEPDDPPAICTFSAQIENGAPGVQFEDVVTACVAPEGGGEAICDSDTAVVLITDAAVPPTLTKTAVSTQNCQIQVDAVYTVSVRNNSTLDSMQLQALVDDQFGNIATPGTLGPRVVSTTCSVPQTIAANATYNCSFTGRITSNQCDFTHIDRVTGTVRDDDGVISSPFDTAEVTVVTTP
ncbi:hypothetical protein OV090_14135 [Nannocystis sp. RBIL2]|uniref:hypothetical protein n=1 Tax=Nannocystis sp. RBIL2 TaxID=2996788 RepID=UPI002271DD64|nr:hypothetical protein [Nannocystis sp. RBIL2]MCY1065916.1 hypothetical protein [Nannocystis sp. RBIL2]